MASKNYIDIKNKFLTCRICLEVYDEGIHTPRLLPCLHTFCSKCIKSLIEQKSGNDILCPFDRNKHRIVSRKGVDTFPKDNTRRDLLEFIGNRDSSGVLCKECNDNNNAIYRCKQCSSFLCIACYDAHKRRFTRDHNILRLEDFENNPELLNEFVPEGICQVSEDYEDRKRSVQCLKLSVKEKIIQMKKEKEIIEKKKSGLQKNGKEIVFGIQKEFDICIKKLNARKEQMVKTANQKIKSKEEILEDQIKSLQEEIEELEERYQYIKETLNCTNAAELLEIENVIQQRLQHLENEESKRIKDVNIDFGFQKNEMITNFESYCNKMGNIVCLKADSATSIRQIPRYTEETTCLKADSAISIRQIPRYTEETICLKADSPISIRQIPRYTEETTCFRQDGAENVFVVVISVEHQFGRRFVHYKFQGKVLREQYIDNDRCTECNSILDLLGRANKKAVLFQKTGGNQITWNRDIPYMTMDSYFRIDSYCNDYLPALKQSLAKYGIK